MENTQKPQRFRSMIVEMLEQYEFDIRSQEMAKQEAIDAAEATVKTFIRHFINTAEELNVSLGIKWVGDMR